MPAFDAGMRILGYHFIPAGAFDAAGNLNLPAELKLPESWSKTVGRVTSSPDWEDLLDVLGVLATPGSDWYCWRVGVNFRDGVLRVIIARPAPLSEAGSSVARNWANNLWPRMVSLRQYAGRKRLLPEGLTEGVANAAKFVNGSSYWDKPLSDEPAKAARDLLKWRVTTGLGLLIHVAEFLGSITTRSKVLATVLWYDPKRGSIPAQEIRWAPLHQLYSQTGLRTIHYWWNYNWSSTKPATYPFPYGPSQPRRGWGVTDVAHEPWELAAALYPHGSWPPPQPPQRPQPVKHRVCEEFDGRRICRWETEMQLTAEVEEVNGNGQEAVSAFDVPDLSALEGRTELAAAPSSEEVMSGEEAEFDPAVGSTEPLVLAHDLPQTGGAFLGGGHIRDGVWYPLEEDEPAMPELVFLPSLGIVARADGLCLGWRPAADFAGHHTG